MDQIKSAIEQLKITSAPETIAKFGKYMELILEWNSKINLTAIKDEKDFISKHFIDSILCANFDEVTKASSVIDVGTGAGFPGIPLALIFPEKSFLLIDSTGKKIKVVGEIAKSLEIGNVKVLHARAEELSRKPDFSGKFDLCVSRAVANLSVLCGYCLPFVSEGGCFIAYKGPCPDEEIRVAKQAIRRLGGLLPEVRKVNMEGFGLDHSFIVINKKVSRETF